MQDKKKQHGCNVAGILNRHWKVKPTEFFPSNKLFRWRASKVIECIWCAKDSVVDLLNSLERNSAFLRLLHSLAQRTTLPVPEPQWSSPPGGTWSFSSDCRKLRRSLWTWNLHLGWIRNRTAKDLGSSIAIWEAIRSQTIFKCRRFTVSSVPCTVRVWVASRGTEWRKWTKVGRMSQMTKTCRTH